MDTEVLLRWVADVAAMEPFDLEVEGESRVELLERTTAVALRHSEVLPSLGRRVDQFLLVLQFALAEAVWDDRLPLTKRRAAVRAIPDLLKGACEQPYESLTVFGFWDTILVPWEREHPWDYSQPLVDDVSSALLTQLGSAHDTCLQLSALHGINHLRDVKTAEAAGRMSTTFTAEALEYSKTALQFKSA